MRLTRFACTAGLAVLLVLTLGAQSLPRTAPGAVPPGHASLAQVGFVRDLVSRLSEDALMSDLRALQAMGTRYAPSRGHQRAAAWAKAQFEAAGLTDVSLDEFSYFDDQTASWETTRNVVAVKPGTSRPERIVVIGAHLDSIAHASSDGRGSASDPEFPSPGVDDDGTGAAAVLAAARLLAPYRFDCTIRFVLFSAEEAGMFGSAHYAARCARRHEPIVAMINVDMLGYVKEEPEDLDLLSNQASTWLLDRVTDAASRYAPDLLVRRLVNDTYDGSDHASFWNNGYAAVCFMDDYYPSSPYYHSPEDTVEHVNAKFLRDGARLAVGTLAELAGPHGPAEEPKGVPVPIVPGWRKASGVRVLATLAPDANMVRVVDVSAPKVTSTTDVSLGTVSDDTWGDPRDYPVSVSPRPGSRLVYVPSIRLRPPAGGRDHGRVEVVDPVAARVTAFLDVEAQPSRGCFDATGGRYFQPSWNVPGIEVFDTASLKRIGRIPTAAPVAALVSGGGATEHRAIGLSSGTSTAVIVDLPAMRVESTLTDVPSPSDAVIVDGGAGLVSSRARASVFEIRLDTGRVTREYAVAPAPTRLVASPSGRIVLCLHQVGSTAEIIEAGSPASGAAAGGLRKLDLGEAVVDGAFADEDTCYLVGFGKRRLLGVSVATGRVFWAMRTGGVRAKADTSRIAVVNAKPAGLRAPTVAPRTQAQRPPSGAR